MTSKTTLVPQKYYRLPWSLTDNGISWLEVTTACNLACKGCYRPHVGGHKTLDQISEDLAVFKKARKSDCMSIAGGDPLVHPQIVEIVKLIKNGGWKPILNTNGLALTERKLKALKQAGLFGFTFHVDTSQDRRDSRCTTERDHNKLRQKFADMVAAEGGLTCSFNQTVTSDTLEQIPDVVRWAIQRPDVIHTIVFILYREPRLTRDFDFYAGNAKIPIENTYEKTDTARWGGMKILKSPDVIAKIREVLPEYEPAAYLNGTEDANSAKWLIATRVCNLNRTFGFVSPQFMEMVQHAHHALWDKWLSYSSPQMLGAGRSAAFGAALIDHRMRKISKNYLKWAMANPLRSFKPAYLQTFTIIQPIDVLEDGRMNMCDGCPDMTVYNGKLYWSCRLEEIKKHGRFVHAVRRDFATAYPG